MATYLLTVLAACLLTLVVFGALAVLAVSLVRGFVVVSPRFSLLPFGLALGLAWFLSLPVCLHAISSPPLSSLPWGHAGEFFILPFLPVSLAAFLGALVFIKRRSNPKF